MLFLDGMVIVVRVGPVVGDESKRITKKGAPEWQEERIVSDQAGRCINATYPSTGVHLLNVRVTNGMRVIVVSDQKPKVCWLWC